MTKAAILDALSREPRGAMASIAEIRAASLLTPSEFDAALISLAESGVLALFAHDDPQSPDGMRQGHLSYLGRTFCGVAIREKRPC